MAWRKGDRGVSSSAAAGDEVGEQTELLAQHDELPTNAAYGLAVVLAEVGVGLEVRHQTPSQPYQLDVALSLSLKVATGLDAIGVAVDVDLQPVGRMVGG